MLKITPSQMEHIELADCAYVIGSVTRRLQIMSAVKQNLEDASSKLAKFIKPKGAHKMAKKCGKGKKKGKK